MPRIASIPSLFSIWPRGASAATGSIMFFALALIAVIWVTGYRQLENSQEQLRRESAMKSANLALAFEQNVAIIANDLDRLLLFLRQSRARAGSETPWQTLVSDTYTVAEQSVQIAVIDRTGKMVTSTAMLHPKEPVDLSDREHYRFHAQSDDDVLYISKPMVGRASGKKSVQFARRLVDSTGAFSGVIVVSLDPEYVTRTYSKLNLGASGGLALVGTDGIVRAGTGRYEAMIGSGFREGTPLYSLEKSRNGTSIDIQKHHDGRHIVATKAVGNHPLEVVVALDDVETSPTWTSAQHSYLAWSIGLSGLILLIMLLAVCWQRRTEKLLIDMAKHDALTGLPNRTSFQDGLSAAIASADTKFGFALHLLDLDAFKPVNDTFGHSAGDELLRAVSQRLLANRRDCDLVARLGGDEFAIIQHNVDSDKKAEVFAKRMCELLEQPFEIGSTEVIVGASIGIARAPIDARNACDLINAADLALYCAKKSGGRQFRRYRDAMTESLHEERELEQELKRALVRQELQLHYQPIVDLKTCSPVGLEALLRWKHADRGYVPPSLFIPIAERSGLINEIGDWVLARACKDAAGLPSNLTIAVNCSPVQFSGGTLLASIRHALEESGLSPDRLDIEITESALLNHTTQTIDQLSEISNMGVMLSMDDFGTGYSSLGYLQQYPFDCIKIDRSFVQSLVGANDKKAIVSAIVQLANSLDMKTIAEGVETVEQLERLREIGCAYAQGYLFSKPLSLSDATRFLSGSEADETRHAA